ncbi:MAG: hypothetical protein OXU27_12210 [Candidatus Poribacteria bacterium]|nr:hypothetical protein [Candidatus Poribacteria bacterium]
MKSFFTVSVCCILFLILLHQANAGPNDAVTISDAELRKIIETRLGKSPGTAIIESEMNGMTGQIFTDSTSTGRSSSITDLTGLEHATGITNMSFHLESIQNLTALADLTQLTHLELENNKATLDLTPLKKLTNLTTLLVRRNSVRSDAPAPITDISGLVDLTKLTRLELTDQRVSSFSALAKMTSLTKLVLSGNRRGVAGSPLSVSHLSNLTALTYLDLRDCDVRNISHLSNLTSLVQLFLNGNTALRDISVVSNFTALTELRLNQTNITNAGLSAVLDDLSSLTTLDIGRTLISDLTVLNSLPGQTLSLLGLINMGPPYLSTARRGWLLKDIASLVNIAANKMTSSPRIQLYYNWNLNYPSIYTVVPNLLANNVGLPFFLEDLPDPELHGASAENHLGRPGTRHPFVVRASMNFFNGYAVNRRFQGVPVRWTVTSPDGTETVREAVTGADGLSRFSITLGDHGEEHTAEAVVPAKSNTQSELSHDELRVRLTATADREAPIPAGLNVTFEDYPETPPIDEFNLTIIFSEPVTGFQMKDITVETELETGTGAASSFEEEDVPAETALKTGTATLKALTPIGGTVLIPIDGAEETADAEKKVQAQTYTATIGVPTDATGTVQLIVHAGAALGSISGQVGPPTDTASEPIAFGQPLSSKKRAFLHASKVAMDKVIFNEIRNASDDKNDWIELKNISDEEIALKDWEISIVIESAPKMIRNTADIGKEDVDIVVFPEDYTLPAGGILLIVNTHPSETDLIAGQEITDEGSDPDMPPQYLIASEMKLPTVPYLLILRSARDKNGKPEAFEDLTGNYFRGFVDYGTQVFPLVHTFRPANRKAAALTQGQAWQRIDIEKRGYTKEAWTVSGHQSGIGYKPGSALETSLGTPGYPNDIVSDESLTGRIIFSEVLYATRGGLVSSLPQWIELYNNTDTAALPINLKGWRLVVEARDSETQHRHSVIELQEDLSIATARTVLLVTRDRRHSGHLREGQVYNLFRHDSSVSKLGLRENTVLPAAGFGLKLLAPDGTLVDSAGNLDGNTGIDTPTWALPSGYTEDGERTSLIRRYEDGTALVGTDATSWVRAADVVLPLELYYGHETDIGSPGYREGGVAPVMLSHFRARRTETGVIVEWATASETDNAGFNILRGQTKDGAFMKVNPALILGGGTTTEQNTYTYQDTTAEANVPYYYRLEEVSLSGDRRALATVRLRGHVSAANKVLWKWADVKSQD